MGNEGELFTIDMIFTRGASSSAHWMYHANYAWNWRPRGGILALTRIGILAGREENEVSHVMLHKCHFSERSNPLRPCSDNRNKFSFPHSPIQISVQPEWKLNGGMVGMDGNGGKRQIPDSCTSL